MSVTKLGRNSLAVDDGGSYLVGSDTIVIAGRAGTSVSRVVVVLDDGTRVKAQVAFGGNAYAGKFFLATWKGKVPADQALAFDVSGKQIGSTTTYYGGGGDS